MDWIYSIAAMLEILKQWVWNEWFWFPSGKGWGWKDLQNTDPNVYYPQLEDLHWTVFLGVVFLGIRYGYEHLIVVPVAKRFGLTERRKITVEKNPVLEKAYLQAKKADTKLHQELSKQTDLSVRQVEVWFRRRRLQDMPSKLDKFRECSWHLLFYVSIFVYGIAILWNKPWFSETKYCWIGWPKQGIDRDVYWYYVLELGFYWSLVYTLAVDHKRKDFYEMVIHHLVTILLIYFSWVLNFVRVGTLVLAVHDASDYWMAAAKMAKYINKQMLCEVSFVIFCITWIISRLIIYPYVVLYTTTVETYGIVMDVTFGSHWFFNFLLYILQVLHIIWTFMIARIALQKFTAGNLQQDVRSDADSDDTVEIEEETKSEKTDVNCTLQNSYVSKKFG
ncbi:hypothetical protein CHS0354_023204 [Potamilus streckersoni]|uniref:Uncharacterized protein n=1 Tax=Potamilus streckersoni TaxID=2493646 RepID=A0AAE0VXV5_9BIVA|nr:hypothetical protein CHS0354_023204 [Potamilus streckersoni]